MTAPNVDGQRWYEKYFGTLEGSVITKVVMVAEDRDLWPTLTIRTPSGKEFHLEISCDEEGNRPGFIHGLPIPH